MLAFLTRLTFVMLTMHICASMDECERTCVKNKDTLTCTDVPSCIPMGITRVVVNNTSVDPVIITASNFTGENWNKVTYLRLDDDAPTYFKSWTLSEASFVALKSVKELHINIKNMSIDHNALVGLSTVEVIDFTGCFSLTVNQLRSLLNGTNKLAGLKKIILSNWNRWPGFDSYDFDDKLVDALLPRNITDIDLSNSMLNALNLTALLKRMEHLKSLNLSHATTAEIIVDNLRLNDTGHLNVWDISWFNLPNQLSFPTIRYVINNFTFDLDNQFGYIQNMLSFPNINATGILKKPFSFWAKDCQVVVTQAYHFFIRGFEFKENNLNRMDLRVRGHLTVDIEYLGLSNNNLEFLHSSILACMPNLTRLDLSRNKMYIMYEEDPQQFGQLLSGVPAITYIDLSHNNLTSIPRDFSKSCHKLSTIDLSFNRLTQFSLAVAGLTKLSIIDLRNNNIKTLDAASLHKLNSFLSGESGEEGSSEVILTSNPISCSVCSAKPFLQWLLSTPLVDIKSQDLDCIDEKGNPVAIDETAISAVHFICIRRILVIIISVTVSATVVTILVIIVSVCLYKRRTRTNTLARRHVVIDKIRDGEGPFEFPVLFSYSSKDDVFAQNNVLPHLNETLRLITGIYHDRNFVCTGDANLRPGFYVHDEIDSCLDRASVVIILVTENYCTSEYCKSELEKAYMKSKPVVLMFKEHVREDLMSRTMKEIYKRNVRVLWTEQEGEYVLQTTWENVCTSIIDLIE